jgi:hypothetical protein
MWDLSYKVKSVLCMLRGHDEQKNIRLNQAQEKMTQSGMWQMNQAAAVITQLLSYISIL